MNSLKQKIQNTMLFSASEKIDFLVNIDMLSDDVKLKFEQIIDEYDNQMITITKDMKQKMITDFDAISTKVSDTQKAQVQSAIDTMKQGLNEMFPN